MPCRCDEMQDTILEAYVKRTAGLLLYTASHVGRQLEDKSWVEILAKKGTNHQGDADVLTQQLCEIITSLSESGKNKVVYNGRIKIARDLADWWEEHEAGEARRAAEDKLKAKRVKALKKLTREERELLGLGKAEL
jgi:translation initiation factor IF-2